MQKNLGKVFKIRLDLEKIVLVIFFGVFLYLGTGFLFDHQLQHDYPYAYMASDAFQHQTRAQSIKDAGNYRDEASYIVMGVEGATGYYPPVLYHLSVILSHLSGLEVYDTIYFSVFFFAALASLVMYLVIRQFNKNVALISLPISLLVFSSGLYTGFLFGHWPTLLSQFFLICIFWYTSRNNLHKSYIFLGIVMAATFMTHTSETLFAAIYLIIFLIGYLLTNKKIDFGIIKNFAFGAIITLALTLYYFIIFKGVWIPRQPFEFAASLRWDNPTIYLMDFKLLLVFMVIGFIASLLFIKKSLVPTIASLSMLLVGLSNYIGFREKAFQLRFFWPIFLSFLVGFGIYWILKLIIKEWKVWHSISLSIILIILVIIPNIPLIPHYQKIQSNGLMGKEHWDMFNWIAKNAEDDVKVYFFYGDIYSQDALLRNAKRAHYQVTPEGFIDAINKREVRRNYDSELPGDAGGGAPIRESLFSFKFGIDELPEEIRFGTKDICNFNYLVFDRRTAQPVFAQYNLLIANELLKKDYIKIVFENNNIIVLKNSNVGADCIEQRNF
ncbi:hypothetical protein HY637_01135 [Candidatus Woesearchaeota archaeon]|nr:hypothetical protein [Candidatus Woesearchaeota archaeon]